MMTSSEKFVTHWGPRLLILGIVAVVVRYVMYDRRAVIVEDVLQHYELEAQGSTTNDYQYCVTTTGGIPQPALFAGQVKSLDVGGRRFVFDQPSNSGSDIDSVILRDMSGGLLIFAGSNGRITTVVYLNAP